MQSIAAVVGGYSCLWVKKGQTCAEWSALNIKMVDRLMFKLIWFTWVQMHKRDGADQSHVIDSCQSLD